MEFVFGDGKLLVTECGIDEERNIIIERKGNGKCGSFCDVPGRLPGEPILDMEDIKESKESVVLTFKNPLSALVLVEKALQSILAFKKSNININFDEDFGLSGSISAILKEVYRKD